MRKYDLIKFLGRGFSTELQVHVKSFVYQYTEVFDKFQRKAGVRLNTSTLPVRGPASLTLMRKYEIIEFLQ